jgi:hypothetical protein
VETLGSVRGAWAFRAEHLGVFLEPGLPIGPGCLRVLHHLAQQGQVVGHRVGVGRLLSPFVPLVRLLLQPLLQGLLPLDLLPLLFLTSLLLPLQKLGMGIRVGMSFPVSRLPHWATVPCVPHQVPSQTLPCLGL